MLIMRCICLLEVDGLITGGGGGGAYNLEG